MSKKQNKIKARKKQKTSTDQLERQLLKTRFPLECQAIPLEALPSNEQEIVKKCINGEYINDDEFTILKKILAKYRPAIEKYNPQETIDAVEKTKNTITTEQEWLDLVDNTRNTLKVNVPYNNQTYPMEFEILPLEDSRIVQTLQTHVELFKDYSQKEIKTYVKAENGEQLTPEEMHIVNKMEKEIQNKASEERIETMNHFLASQLRLPESTSNINTRKRFWEKFPFLVKSAIMIKVEDRLGLTEKSNEELFPDG